jgi:hypothetical protein
MWESYDDKPLTEGEAADRDALVKRIVEDLGLLESDPCFAAAALNAMVPRLLGSTVPVPTGLAARRGRLAADITAWTALLAESRKLRR